MALRVQEAVSLRLDEIYRYTRDRWVYGHDSALISIAEHQVIDFRVLLSC